MQPKLSRDELIQVAWHKGALKWLLKPHQGPIYDKIRDVLASDDPYMNSYVIDCARQFGKSFIMFTIAVEECIRNPKHTYVYVGPLKSQVNEIINGNTFGVIFATCPRSLVPTHTDSSLIFPNGARIRLAGSDNRNYEALRGGAAHGIFLDEAGFINDLTVGVLPTVEPMTKTTGGKVIFASTPPERLDHDYYEVLRDHDERGLISTYTIWDDKSVTERQLEKIINQCRGQHTTTFKREYECKRIAEASKQVLPELSKEMAERLLLTTNDYRTAELYQFWHKYVVADWGGRDKTAILFAHYNYQQKKLIVEDHLDLVGSDISPKRIAVAIKDKIETCWGEPINIRFICDNNNILIQNHMVVEAGLPFVPTSKARLDQMVQKVRDWIFDERIEFGPDAEFALKSAMSGFWNKHGEFSQSKTYGHFDHLAALVYLVRNVNVISDPAPVALNFNGQKQFYQPSLEDRAKTVTNVMQILNPRKSRSF